jgi:peptidoglycan/LPS O-acetylase OafA/YrhL
MALSSAPKKLSLLDPGLFRLLLACIVFAQHSTRLVLGGMAVFLFFTLSGFWINRMWVEKYSQCASPVKTFYISRIWRLLPAFWIANVLAICIMAAKGSLPPTYQTVPWNWHGMHALIANISLFGYASLPHADRILDTAWSLDVEVQFYLLFPMLVLLWPRMRNAVLLVAGSIGVLLILMGGEPLHRNVLYYLAFFAIGMWVEEKKWLPSRRMAMIGLSTAAIGICFCLALPQTRGLLIAPAHSSGNVHLWTYTTNCLLAFLLLPLTLCTTGMPSNRTDRMFGDLSYLVYLFHMPIVALLLYGGRYTHANFTTRLIYLVIVWLGTFASSFAFWRFVHLPLEKWRRRFTEHTPARAISTQVLDGAALSTASGD